MSGSIIRRHLHKDWELVGVYSSAANYLIAINKSAAEEGMIYYDTTLNQLRTYDGSSWSPAGMNSVSTGSLDAGAVIGAKITSVGSIEIEYSASTANLLILDANGTTNVDILDISSAAGSGDLINLTQGGTGLDINGTSSSWYVQADGDALFHTVSILDDLKLHFGGTAIDGGDITVLFHDGAVGTAGNGLLIAGSAAVEQIQIGDASYGVDVWFVGTTATTNFMRWDANGGADAVGSLLFDNTDIQLGNSDRILFGDTAGGDAYVYWDNANQALVFNVLDAGDGVWFGADAAGCQVMFNATTTGQYVLVDANNSDMDFIGFNLDLDDSSILHLGTSDDFAIQYIGASDLLRISGDDLRLDFGVSGAGFDMYWYTEDTTNYVYFDEDNSRIDLIDVDLRLDDDAIIYLGSSQDATIQFDGTNNTLDITGNVVVTGTITASGGIDVGGFSFGDDEALNFGASNDYVLHYDSTATELELDAAAANGEFAIGTTTATDVRLNGATAGYDVLFDASADSLIIQDNAKLLIGTSGDIVITGDNTNFDIAAGAANGLIDIGRSTNTDLLFHGGTATRDLSWDASANTLAALDNAKIGFGNTAAAPDVSLSWNATDLLIEPATQDTGAIKIGSTNAIDFFVYGGTNTKYVQLNTDDAALDVDLVSFALRFLDGTSTFTFGPTASNTLPIDAGTANETITIGNSTATDVLLNGTNAGRDAHWDSSANTLGLLDNALLGFGNTAAAPDVSFKWDATNLLIESLAANTEIKIGATTNTDLGIYGGTATKYWLFDTDDSALTFDCVSTAIDFTDATSHFVFGPAASNALPIDAATANETINVGATTATDVKLHGTDANRDAHWDSSADTLGFLDNALLGFGNTAAAPDVSFKWDATNLLVESAAANTEIKIGATTNTDLGIYGGTATKYWRFDTDDAALTFDCVSTAIDLTDGTSHFVIGPAATNALPIDASTANETINIGATTATDVILHGTTATRDAHWDSSANTLGFLDNGILGFGNTAAAPDISFKWDATNLLIEAAAADGEIKLGATTNTDLGIYGQTATKYWRFDTDDSALTFDCVSTAIDLHDGTSHFVIGPAASNALPINASTANETINVGAATNTDIILHGGTAGYDAHWDSSANTLGFLDNGILGFGNTAAAPDVTLKWDATNLLIESSAANTVVKVGATTNTDLAVYGQTATSYWQFDTDDASLTLDFVNTSADFTDGTSHFVIGPTATNALNINASVADEKINFGPTTATDVIFHGADAARDAHWDASADTLGLLDNGILGFGNTAAAPDVTFKWDASNLLIESSAANTLIKIGATTNTDVGIYGGTATNYWQFDTDDSALTLDCVNTSIDLTDGTSHFVIGPAATNALAINAGTANETINIGATTNTDVVFHGGTAGGDCSWDASANQLLLIGGAQVSLNDDVELLIGTGTTNLGDFKIWGNGTGPVLNIDVVAAGSGEINIGNDADDVPLKWFGETTGDFAYFTADQLQLEDIDLCLGDATLILFGDSLGTGSMSLSVTSNLMTFGQVAAGTGAVAFGVNDAGMDVTFYGDTASRSCLWDCSADTLLLADNAILAIGNNAASPDFKIASDGTSATATGAIAFATAVTMTTGVQQAAVARIATAAPGGTTGVIADGTGIVVVTCDDANKVITLPTPTPGNVIRILPNATGYELRSSDPATIAINGGVGANVESAVGAAVMVLAVCTSATTWVCNTFAAVGTEAALEAAA